LVASSVTLIEAQRLVRQLCTKCRTPYEPPPEVLTSLGGTSPQTGTFYQAVGCRTCHGTGYHGRMGILEVLVIDERIRELIVTKAQSWEMKQYAVEHLGMRTLRYDGLLKAERGETTLAEVIAATAEE